MPDEYEGEERNKMAMDKAKDLVREVAGIVAITRKRRLKDV